MISFIIFETDEYMKDLYIKVLKKFLYTAHDYYMIHEFDKYNYVTWSEVKKIEGKRIYLISSTIDGINGFDLARKIRLDGDVESSIIIFTPKGKRCSIKNVKYTMVLNVIERNERLVKELFKSLEEAYKIATTHNTLTFSSFDEVYRLPYEDIYYIEKNINGDSITIYTKDDTYMHYMSIKKMAKKLEIDTRFMRTHRSCIINLYKISSYDSKGNLIIFDNGMTTNLVSREFKRILTDRLIKDTVE